MDTNKEKYTFSDFIEIIKILRSPNGCPWDKEQTHESIKSNLIEESYEFLSEIDKNNVAGMKEELGDVLLQVLLHSQIAQDNNEFCIDDVIDGIAKKMIFRHPHVFGDKSTNSSEEAYELFKSQKDIEKHYTKQVDVLKGIPKSFPALMRAQKTASKLRKIRPQEFKIDKSVRIRELKELVNNLDINVSEEELGNVLLKMVFLAKELGIESEVALSNSNKKLINKFECVEEKIMNDGKNIVNMGSDEFNTYWSNN